jgi:hypothetical protein
MAKGERVIAWLPISPHLPAGCLFAATVGFPYSEPASPGFSSGFFT